MATITLNGTSFNYSMGMSAFNGLGSAFSSLKRTTNELNSALNSLESKVNIGSIATITKTSQNNVQKTQKRELTKTNSLTIAYDKLDQLITDTGKIDNQVSEKISNREDDFYQQYSYLKPDCKKTKKEQRADWWAEKWRNFKEFCGGVIGAIANIASSVFDFCKKHWKEILKVLAIVALVVASVLLLVFVPGGGLISAILLGAAKGCLVGLVTSVGINGIINKVCGRKFFSGALNAAFSGAVGGFIGGAITGGLVGNAASMTKSASQGLLKIGASSFGRSIARGALVGATSASISNVGATALSYWIDNGTLKGSTKELIVSAISGLISGGVIGGIGGGFQYRIQNPTPVNPKAYEYELKALMQQGIPEQEAVNLIEQFQQGINPGGKFAFHFTTLEGGQGITDSGKIRITQLGFRGKGVYAGTTPLPTWEVKHIPYIGWGIGESPVRIPIILDSYPTKQVRLPIYSTVIESVVQLISN